LQGEKLTVAAKNEAIFSMTPPLKPSREALLSGGIIIIIHDNQQF
jgi:hypothetical protein